MLDFYLNNILNEGNHIYSINYKYAALVLVWVNLGVKVADSSQHNATTMFTTRIFINKSSKHRGSISIIAEVTVTANTVYYRVL